MTKEQFLGKILTIAIIQWEVENREGVSWITLPFITGTENQ